MTEKFAEAFKQSERPHILMVTNHGIHQWDVIPGLPDTGGQNMFVNQLSATLAWLGFRITIANRGGYPHPVTGEPREGVHYRDTHQRIVYLKDDVHEFIHKEEMNSQTLLLAEYLLEFLQEEASKVDLIISHYWDGAKVASLFNNAQRYPVEHIWVPHSLGMIKKRHISSDLWDELHIDERIRVEQEMVGRVDGVAATSSLVRHALVEDYGLNDPLFLPPCIDTERYHPLEIDSGHDIWSFLAERSQLDAESLPKRRIITEVSRTDPTKRKDVLIKAFAQVHESFPETLLIVSIDEQKPELAESLHELIQEKQVAADTIVVGYVKEQLPAIYAITDIYCSPSVMEGFGMSVQEAAATHVPIVGSDHIPYVAEYLLGDD
ncbi:MAG: glycosyltransferase, partial [Anaerolineae bacterium]